MAAAYGALPFNEQIEFFRRKLDIPTRAYTDLHNADHDVGFMVAGANKANLVADFRSAIDKAISEGTTLDTFRKDFEQIVAKHGWSYKGTPGWRSRVIYETNLRTSYAAGRYEQLQAVKSQSPYWEFHHTPVNDPRELHVAWNGIILHADDPWWRTHYPPLGYGCQCIVYARSAAQLQRQGKTPLEQAPPIEYETKIIGKTGPTPRTVTVPKGVTPGFDYIKGESVTSSAMKNFMDNAATIDPTIAAASVLSMVSRERFLGYLEDTFQGWAEPILQAKQATGDYRAIGALRPQTLAALGERNIQPNTAGIIIRDRDLLHLVRDSKQSATTASGQPKALTSADIDSLPRILAAPSAVLFDKQNSSLVYVFDSSAARTGKIAVMIDFAAKVREPNGKRISDLFNVVRSGGLVNAANLETAQYALLEGQL